MHEIFELENGVRIVAERLPHVRSAAVGIWVGSGTRHESPEQNGASHFIEHMLFKGTATRDASQLAELMDILGGELNAFTTKECTCYYGRVPDYELKTALELLADMFFNSAFDEESVSLERGVINEEINMANDDPEGLCVDKLLLSVFGGTPLGMPILGTKETLAGMSGRALKEYRESHYTGEGIVISLAGNYEDRDIETIKELFSAADKRKKPQSARSEYKKSLYAEKKQTEQSHIAISFPGQSYKSEKRFALQLLNGITGGSMSSRLFQRIREKLGLCYSVYSFLSSHEDTGALGIYVGTGAETEKRAVEEIGAELSKLAREGIKKDELEKVRKQIKAGMLMSVESTYSRMNHMGKGLLLAGRVMTSEEIAQRYDAVTAEDIAELASGIYNEESVSVSAVTREGGAERYTQWLADGFIRGRQI